jgi:hypothetical protein
MGLSKRSSRLIVVAVIVLASYTAFIGWNVARGVPLNQVGRMFSDNPYKLYVRNDTTGQVRLLVGFEKTQILVAPGATKLIRHIPDYTDSFPVRITPQDSSHATCFPIPFFIGRYPASRVVVRVTDTRPGRC